MFELRMHSTKYCTVYSSCSNQQELSNKGADPYSTAFKQVRVVKKVFFPVESRRGGGGGISRQKV